MSLRRRLLLASAPLTLAVALLGVFAVRSVTSLGHLSQAILADNYRSVLAAQRMNEALGQLDRAVASAAAGVHAAASAQLAGARATFESELAVEEGNITEPGEEEAARALRAAWQDYAAQLDGCLQRSDAAGVRDCYFRELEGRFLAAKRAADRILALNQDAMLHKSERARREAERASAMMLGAALAALAFGAFATSWLAARILRPLSVFGQAVEQFGRGDFAVRALVSGSDEIAGLAHTFNAMADRIEEYRRSSLGELVQAQLAAQAAIDALPDPILVFAPGGDVLSSNGAADALLRVRAGAALDLGARGPALQRAIETARDHALRGHGAYATRSFEDAVVVAADAGERSYLPQAQPVYEESGAIVGATVALQDVTRLRRIDELRDDLVSTVAHQLRTPLTSLRMAIHLCLEGVAGTLTERQKDLLHAGREECERLQATVDELLEVARLQGGRVALDLDQLSAASLLAAAERAARPAAEAKGLDFACEPAPAQAKVRADRTRVALVFANLLENAIRHSPPAGRVVLRARRDPRGIRFEVQDAGPGIPPDQRLRVFEKFVRLPGAPPGGAGLGLWIARDVVRAHGGEIGVEEAPGGGSVFWFSLPV